MNKNALGRISIYSQDKGKVCGELLIVEEEPLLTIGRLKVL
jgi:hypothetical protein